MSAARATPSRTAARQDRQEFPDQLRGLALLGIVLVNAPFLGASLGGFGALGGLSAQTAEFAVTVAAQGKLYLIFAFLFGYSATFMLRAVRTCSPCVARVAGGPGAWSSWGSSGSRTRDAHRNR